MTNKAHTSRRPRAGLLASPMRMAMMTVATLLLLASAAAMIAEYYPAGIFLMIAACVLPFLDAPQ